MIWALAGFWLVHLVFHLVVYLLTPEALAPVRWKTLFTTDVLAAAWFPAVPVMSWWIHRSPLHRGGYLRQALLHGPAILLISVAEVLLFYSVGLATGFKMPPFPIIMAAMLPMFLATATLIYGGVATVVTLLSSRHRLHRVEVERMQLSAQLEAERLRLVKARIEPAFVSATLERIEQVVEARPEIAERAVSRLADVLRLNLDLSARDSVSFAEDLDYLEALVELRAVTAASPLTLEARVSRATFETTVPAFTLRHLAGPFLDELVAQSQPQRLILRAATSAHNVTLELLVAAGSEAPRLLDRQRVARPDREEHAA